VPVEARARVLPPPSTASAAPGAAAVSTAASTAPAVSTRAPAAPATARAIFARTCLVHRETATTEVLSIELVDCIFGFLLARHFDEAESAGITSKLVRNDGS